MPRDSAGVFTHEFTFVDDATGTPKVPFDPARFDARFEDVAGGLNDIPRSVPEGTDPNSVLPASIMEVDGITYICVVNGSSGFNIWKDISTPGITDAAGFISQSQLDDAIAALRGGSPEGLDTLVELAAALGNDADYATTISNQLLLKASINHSHTTSDITGLDSALATLAAGISETTTGSWTAFYSPPMDWGGLSNGGAFSNESLPTNRISLSEGTATTDLGGLT